MTQIRTVGRGITLVVTLLFTAILNSCGGGVSASSDPAIAFTLSPSTATAYSGVPITLNIAGGGLRVPFQIVSSNSAILPVPVTSTSATQIVLTPFTTSTPQIVTITASDQAGKTATASITVQPNFISGDLTVTGTAPASVGVANCQQTGAVCSGQSGLVTVSISQNGSPARGRSVRFDVVQGAFRFPTDVAQTQFASTITVTSDEAGKARAILRADAGVPFQNAIIRATDVASGAFLASTFFIRQATVAGAEFSTVPAEWVVTGPFKNQCSGGAVDFLIFGGTPPFTIRTSNANNGGIIPSITTTDTPNRFTAFFSSAPCSSDSTIIYTVTDATGLTILPKLTLKPGTEEIPPPTLEVAASAITLACGQQAQVLAAVTSGGPNPPSITASVATGTSPATALTVSVSGNAIVITRSTGTVASTNAVINVGAGSAAPKTITVSTPATCP